MSHFRFIVFIVLIVLIVLSVLGGLIFDDPFIILATFARNLSPLFALKGLVCPQGTCMPSRDLYALKGFGPKGQGSALPPLPPARPPGPWAHGAQIP